MAAIVSGTIYTVGDYFLLSWIKSQRWENLVAGIGCWFVASLFCATSYWLGKAISGVLILTMVNLVALSVMSWWMLNQVPTTKEWIGIVLAVVAIVLLR